MGMATPATGMAAAAMGVAGAATGMAAAAMGVAGAAMGVAGAATGMAAAAMGVAGAAKAMAGAATRHGRGSHGARQRRRSWPRAAADQGIHGQGCGGHGHTGGASAERAAFRVTSSIATPANLRGRMVTVSCPRAASTLAVISGPAGGARSKSSASEICATSAAALGSVPTGMADATCWTARGRTGDEKSWSASVDEAAPGPAPVRCSTGARATSGGVGVGAAGERGDPGAGDLAHRVLGRGGLERDGDLALRGSGDVVDREAPRLHGRAGP